MWWKGLTPGQQEKRRLENETRLQKRHIAELEEREAKAKDFAGMADSLRTIAWYADEAGEAELARSWIERLDGIEGGDLDKLREIACEAVAWSKAYQLRQKTAPPERDQRDELHHTLGQLFGSSPDTSDHAIMRQRTPYDKPGR